VEKALLILNRYRLKKLIGQGGFGKTFLAVDRGQSPPVMCIVQQLEQHSSIPAKLAQLGKHPQIPTSIAYFAEEQYFYWVQELIEGNHLETLLSEQGEFNETQIWQLLKNLLPVLQLIHGHQMIHCNIQPENIILKTGSSGEFVLVNFALAQIVDQGIYSIEESIVGSPEYAAPEQIRGNPGFSSDLYSLGVTCIYLLTQIPPFDLFDIGENHWVWRQYLTTKVSDRLAQVLDKLLEYSILSRFQSADAVMEAIGMKNLCKTPKSQISTSPDPCLFTLTSHINQLGNVNALAFRPQVGQLGAGEILASGDDHQIKLWDLNTHQVLFNLSGHTRTVRSIAFSPDGEILATASDDQTIKLWNGETLQHISNLIGHSHAVKSLAFHPDGQVLASGSWDKTIKIWDVNQKRVISTLIGHRLQVNAIAFHPQGRLLASGSCDRQIYLWREEPENRSCYTLSGILSGHAWAVLAIAFSPNGKILATGSDDNTVKLWDVNTGQVISTFSGHSWSVVAVAFTNDSETLISASWDKTIKLWSVSTGAEIATLDRHTDAISTMAISPITQLIASGNRDKMIKVWRRTQQ